MEEGFVVRFRGVRGRYPVPGATTLKYGGNTPCVEVWAGGRLIILDAGTGLIALGNDLMAWHRQTRKPVVATLFFSHTHHDHTQGFPFFRPAHLGTSTLYMFGPQTFDQDLEEVLTQAMLPSSFPISLSELKAFKIISNISEAQVVLIEPQNKPHIRNIYRDPIHVEPDTVQIRVFRSLFHPSGGVSTFRIEWDGKSMVYATDTEGVVGGDTNLVRFARQGWGHSTPEMAIAVARRAQVRQLALFHHEPLHDDAQLDEMLVAAQKSFCNTVMAYEGLAIRL
jgi:phosphoribosyl 1,2-cyclic phosphodiesterase